MSYDHDKFAYEQAVEVWVDGDVIGKKYNSDAIILDVMWQDDDNLFVLLVEEEEDSDPFVIILINLDALDVRREVKRAETLRYAVIEWEAL